MPAVIQCIYLLNSYLRAKLLWISVPSWCWHGWESLFRPPFLDILVRRRDNGELTTSVFRKTTKCVEHLFNRVETHCSTPETKEEELRYLKRKFSLNGYPSSFVQKTLRKRPAGRTIARPNMWQAIPYIANISEAVARPLKPHGLGVAHQPAGTLRSRLMRIKVIDPSEQSSIIYRAQCKDCSSTYTEQTSRRLATRIKSTGQL